MPLTIFTVDSSFSSTGLASVSQHAGADFHRITWRCARIKTEPSGTDYAPTQERIAVIVSRVRDTLHGWALADGKRPDGVAIEGPSFASPGQAHRLSGLWWTMYAMLTQQYIDVLVIPPTSRIKYATGNGSSGKDEVQLAVSRRYPDAPITCNDEADAVAMAAAMARLMKCPVEQSLPQSHLAALIKLQPAMDAMMLSRV
jgi:Holliday junction resolvasome RuvABC endonuclease subunit